MAFQALSLSHDAAKGSKGVQVNGYAAESAGITDRPTAQQASNDPNAAGTTCSIVGQTTGNIGDALTTSAGTTLTVTDSSVYNVGDVVISTQGTRVVTAITDATTVEVNVAFDTSLGAQQLTVYSDVYHTSECVKNAAFQGHFYFEDSLNTDVGVELEAVVVAVS